MEENLRPPVGVGVMIVRDGKILMGKRLGKLGFGTYGWLGGHVEYGEKLKDCATREVLEETGLIVTKLEFLSVNSVFIGDKNYIDIEFLATEFTGTPQILEPSKIDSWNWYPIDDLPQPLFPPCITAMKCYKEKLPTIQ